MLTSMFDNSEVLIRFSWCLIVAYNVSGREPDCCRPACMFDASAKIDTNVAFKDMVG